MKQLLFKSLILAILVVLSLNFILDPIFRGSNANSKTFHQFNYANKDSIDILILGSSHAKNAYFPSVIDSILNTKSFNLSTEGQNYITTNLLLESALKQLKPELVIVDLFPALMNLPTHPKSKSSQLRVIDYTPFSFRRLKIIEKIYNLKEMPSVLSETIRNHDKWFDRNWKLQEFEIDNPNLIFDNGYFNSIKKIGSKEKEKYKDFILEYKNYLKVFPSQKQLNNFTKDFTDIIETIEICKKFNINVVFVSAPYFDSFYRDGLNIKHFLLNRYFESQEDIDYIDFNTKFNELGLTFEDYWDKGHLNINGSTKVSTILSKELAALDYFEIKDSTYYHNRLSKISPRKIKNIQEKIDESLSNQIQKILEKGVTLNAKHKFKDIYSFDKATFNIDNNSRYIVFESTNPKNEPNLKDYYFLISKTVNKEDFDKRPKWQHGTDKNKLHWEIYPKSTTINNKNYMLLVLDRKCEITKFDEVRVVLKNKKTKQSVKGTRAFTLSNVSIIK